MEYKRIDSALLAHLPNSAVSLFAVFSRFECALKRSGNHYGDGDAQANWDKFTIALGNQFFEEVCPSGNATLLIDKPPKKQVVVGGILDWQEAAKATNVQELFVSVRRVRNNLFHGGKYPSGPVKDASRDEQLLAESLFVLDLALQRAPDVMSYFQDGLG